MEKRINEKSIKMVKDYDEVIFDAESDFFAFVKSEKEATEEKKLPLNALAPKGVEYSTFFDDKKAFGSSRVYADMEVPDVLAPENEFFMDSLEDKGGQMFIPVPEVNKYIWVPVRAQAYASLLNIAGLACKGMKNVSDEGAFFSVPPEERAKIIDTFLQRAKDVRTKKMTGPRMATVIIVNRKVNYFGSSDYLLLTDDLVFSSVRDALKEDYTDAAMASAVFTYEKTVADFQLNDDELNDQFGEVIGDDDVTTGIRVINSASGTAAARVLPYVEFGGKKIAFDSTKKTFAVKHYGKEKDVKSLFEDELCKFIKASFGELDEIIEELGNTELKNPAKVVQDIIKNVKFLNKNDAKVKMAEASNMKEATAIDVVLLLADDTAVVTQRWLFMLDYKAIDNGTYSWANFKK